MAEAKMAKKWHQLASSRRNESANGEKKMAAWHEGMANESNGVKENVGEGIWYGNARKQAGK
jgi:hypothetical protein